jgi:hypothetical protein
MPIEQGIRPDLPQSKIPGLDLSFLANLHMILQGRTAMQVAADLLNGRVAKEEAIRRVAHAIAIPKEHSIQLYVCSDELCKLLAVTEEQRVADIAQRWHALLWASPPQNRTEPETRRQFRAWVLTQLVTLAQEAVRSGRKLMIRIEYRRHTRDAATGIVRRPEETRH